MKFSFDQPKLPNFLCSGWAVAACPPDMMDDGKWGIFPLEKARKAVSVDGICLVAADPDELLAELSETIRKIDEKLAQKRLRSAAARRRLLERRREAEERSEILKGRVGPEIFGKLAGYWNLARTEVADGIEAWPFGQEPWDGKPGLVSLLPNGRIVRPTIPSVEEASRWVGGLGLVIPDFRCDCGAVHWKGGGIVSGVEVEEFGTRGEPGYVKSVRLTTTDSGRRNCIPEEILPVEHVVLLEQLEASAGRDLR